PNPDMRYQTAASFREDLERFERRERTQAEQEDQNSYYLPTERFDDPSGEATHRTGYGQEASSPWATEGVEAEPTRRTGTLAPTPESYQTHPIEAASKPTANKTVGPTPKPDLARLVKRGIQWAVILILLASVGLIINETVVMYEASKLKEKLPAEKNLDDVWNRFDSLKQRSLLGFGLRPVQQSLKDKLVSEADRVFKDFLNNDSPTIKEQDWQDAKRHLERAA